VAEQSVGILFKMSSDFVQQTPPKFIYSVICLARGFAPRFGGQFCEQIKGLFEINFQPFRLKTAVHPANAGYCPKGNEPIFFFRRWRKAKRDFIKLSVWRFLFQLQLRNKNYD